MTTPRMKRMKRMKRTQKKKRISSPKRRRRRHLQGSAQDRFFSFTTKEEMCSCVSHIKEAHLLHIQEAHLLHRHLCKLKKKLQLARRSPKGSLRRRKAKEEVDLFC